MFMHKYLLEENIWKLRETIYVTFWQSPIHQQLIMCFVLFWKSEKVKECHTCEYHEGGTRIHKVLKLSQKKN